MIEFFVINLHPRLNGKARNSEKRRTIATQVVGKKNGEGTGDYSRKNIFFLFYQANGERVKAV